MITERTLDRVMMVRDEQDELLCTDCWPSFWMTFEKWEEWTSNQPFKPGQCIVCNQPIEVRQPFHPRTKFPRTYDTYCVTYEEGDDA